MYKHKLGFTIVELLIVIVVIGILAAIVIVAYVGVQNRANDTAVQSDLKNMGQKIISYTVENPSLPLNQTDLATLSLKASKTAYMTSGNAGNLIYCLNTTNSQFMLSGMSKSGKKYFFLGSNGQPQEYTGSQAWTSATYDSICQSIDSTMTTRGGGYIASDTTTGPWRAWVGGN